LKKKLYLILLTVLLGFGSILFIDYYFSTLNDQNYSCLQNAQNKQLINTFVAEDLNILEARFYQLAIDGTDIKIISDISKKIDKIVNNILDSLKILQNGGILERKINLNIVGHNSMKKHIEYHKNVGEVSLVAIDLYPKVRKIIRMKRRVINLLKKKIRYENDKEKILKIDKKLTLYYKSVPSYFNRMIENVNRLIYESNLEYKKFRNEMIQEKKRYELLQLSVTVAIILLIFIIIFLITKNIDQVNKKLLKLNQNLIKRESEISNILDSQSNIVIVSDSKKIIYSNRSILKYIPDYDSVEKFIADNRCICDYFESSIPNKEYITSKTYNGKSWVEHILSSDQRDFKVAIKNDNKLHHFSISVKEFEAVNNKKTIILTLSDITDLINAQTILQEQKDKLYFQANYDQLTLLPNKNLLIKELSKNIDKFKKMDIKFAVIFIDIDNFKEINDSLGYKIGDKLLKVISFKLTEYFKKDTLIARISGDEFVVILENIISNEDLKIQINGILNLFSQKIEIEDYVLYGYCSIGVSIFPDHGTDLQKLLRYADTAMHKAKANGKNRFEFYDNILTEYAAKKIILSKELREAINNDEFTVYLQPQVDAKNGNLIGAEALVRWISSKRGFVSPGEFIPFAEESGLIIQIDKLTMTKAMRQFSNWYSYGLNPGILYLNLSAKQLQEPYFVEEFSSIIDSTNCKPEWIGVEVVESELMKDMENSIKKLQTLSELGVEVAIDDFGTGYSSLSYIKHIPLDKLKIDISFIKDLPYDRNSAAIVKTIIALGENLDLQLLAEGVENIEQREFLINNGCKNIQGYLYSKPVKMDEYESLININFNSFV